MGMSESALCQMDRLSPRERRQNAILDAAEHVFAELGYADAPRDAALEPPAFDAPSSWKLRH